MPDRYVCEKCGRVVRIGDWPLCGDAKNSHGVANPSKGFLAYYDDNLMKTITNPGDRNVEFKPHWERDHIVKIEPKDHPAQYYRELNDRRRERAEKEKREHGR